MRREKVNQPMLCKLNEFSAGRELFRLFRNFEMKITKKKTTEKHYFSNYKERVFPRHLQTHICIFRLFVMSFGCLCHLTNEEKKCAGNEEKI